MTESELWELIVTYNGNAMTGVTIYFSALTGYLIVAYMIGNRLTAMQSAIITVGFVVFQLLMIFATLGLVSRAVFLIGKTSEEYRSGIMVNESFALRITSYNVCYTKLLRALNRGYFHLNCCSKNILASRH